MRFSPIKNLKAEEQALNYKNGPPQADSSYQMHPRLSLGVLSTLQGPSNTTYRSPFLSSLAWLLLSVTMHAKIHPQEPGFRRPVVLDDKLSNSSATTLTVWRKSLLFSCNGFAVFDSSGNLVFRVDNYTSDLKNEIILMDAGGMALLTIQRKSWLSLQNQWKGFQGDFREGQKPLFVVRRATSLLIPTKTLAEVYMYSSATNKAKPQFDYRAEGCYAKRYFTILNSFNEVIAEVKPKQVRPEITLGADVFNLTVSPGYDHGFIMGLIVVLDQMMPS